MTQLEIKEERDKLVSFNEALFAQVKTEDRTMTKEEKEKIKLNLQKLEDLNLNEAANGLKVPEGKEVTARDYQSVNYVKKEKFSMIKTIRDVVNNKRMSDIATDINLLGAQEFRNAGINPEGGLLLPSYYERADILAGTATAGQEIVAEDKKGILPPLVDKLVFSQVGATFMPGLVGNVSIPSYAGTTVAWKTEVQDAADGAGTFSEVTFSPKRLTGYLDVSKTFLAQDGVGAERLLLDNIANAVARMLEKTVLGPSTVAASYPSGIGYKINTASSSTKAVLTGATITWAKIVGIESEVDTSNALQGNLAYMTNAIGRGILKTTDKGVANDTGDFLMSEDNMINGYPCLVTNSIVSTYGTGGDGNMVVFGNWADLMIGQWGGYDITVDPYSLAISNQVRIVINAYFDAKGLRGANGTSGADLDEYALSFAAESIK
jgi:HK97 family phage major capsid protein